MATSSGASTTPDTEDVIEGQCRRKTLPWTHALRHDRARGSSSSTSSTAIEIAVELLFELCRPDPTARRSLFADFAPQLLISHSAEVKVAYLPFRGFFTELMTEAEAAGLPGADPRRLAALTMQTTMFIAQASGVISDDEPTQPITAGEIWDFCAHGVVR